MKKIYHVLVFLSLSSFIFTNCKKSEDPHVVEDSTPVPTPQKQCMMTAELGPIGNHTYDYTYNDKGQLVQMVFHTVPAMEDSYRFTYEYNDKGQRVKEISYRKNGSSEIDYFSTYEYDVQGKMIKAYNESYYDPQGGPKLGKVNTLYYYNDKGQLIKIKSEGVDAYQSFTYNDNDDLIKVEYVYEKSGQKELLRTYEYDTTKPAFIVPETWLLFMEHAKYSKHFCKKGYMYNEKGYASIFNEMAIEKYTAEGYPEVLAFYSGGNSKKETYSYTYQCK